MLQTLISFFTIHITIFCLSVKKKSRDFYAIVKQLLKSQNRCMIMYIKLYLCSIKYLANLYETSERGGGVARLYQHVIK